MNERLCCYVAEQGKLREGCRNQAGYQIWTGTGPDEYTESCDEHLEEMLDDHGHFNVFRIYAPEHAHDKER